MRMNRPKTEFFTEPADFFAKLSSGQCDVQGWDFFSDDVVSLTYTAEEGFEENSPHVNVVLAA